ncbi:Hsp90 ATPase activator family protein, putative [Synechococcus sp. PCC 7335]|uniref:SRPBCC domain-containing protein n=1 Tax=Synechococcus sp. (strain ATCC 29403 / PCC 7335) TaxID=91464 RepID=UPI00017EB137|nr:SRPBCC domain-containing protein [Synechococcus sp. PCC 7335]EDX87467.1 Hsp90 ATPase activator family protein, putative [Synechococcus sp. PCC 7335]
MAQPAPTAKQHPNFRQRMALMNGWETEVVINAPREMVWDQVTNFEAYSEWNPFVRKAQAEFVVGKKIQFLEDLEQFGQHWLEATFLSIDPYNAFVWKGYFGASFLFSVRHTFTFEAISKEETYFSQSHKNFGLLIPYLALRGIYCVSYQKYLDFNQALKERCEST